MKSALLLIVMGTLLGLVACTTETVKEVPVDRVVTQEVVREVPVEKIVEVEKEVIRTVEVEKPVEVIREVVKEIRVPGETIVVEKEVVREVPMEVVVEKEVVREVPKEVVVLKEVVREVEVVVIATAVPIPFGAPKRGGTVVWAGQADPPSIDLYCHTTSRGGVGGHVYERLFAWNAERTKGLPQMIDSWTLSDSGRDYTFTLRDRLVFHDGGAVTAADAVASTIRWSGSAHSLPKVVWEIASPQQTVVDSKTWEMTTGKPFGLWPVYMAFNGVYVQPSSIAVTPPEMCIDPLTQAIGSGPYTFVEWIPGDRVVMERFSDYVPRTDPADGSGGGKIAYFDLIRSVFISDASAKVAGLRTGQINILSTVAGDFREQLVVDPEVTVAVVGPGTPPYLWFNKTTKPFWNKKVRQAFLMAADMEAWMIASFGEGGDWTLDCAIFMSDGPWATQVGCDKYYKPDGIDLEAARALYKEGLEEEGMTLDDEINLLAANNIFYMDGGGSYTKQVLELLGSPVNRPNIDWATVIQWKINGCGLDYVPGSTAPGGGWHMYHTRTGPFDPLTNDGFSKTTSCGWQSPELDSLIEDWLTAPTLKEQKELIDEMQLLVYEEVPYIQIGSGLSLMAYRNEMAYTPTAGGFTLTGAWFK